MAGNISAHIILYCFLSLLLWILAQEIRKKLKIPVSLTLLIFGVFVRAIGFISPNLYSTVLLVDGTISPIIQLAIVPAIIFEAAFATNWYTFKREFFQILPMATSVVVLTAIFTALVFKHVLMYDYTWDESLILGLILSATDHVAVESILKDVHANEKFETLVGGETLLNEATVLVIYKLLYKSIADSKSAINLFVYSLRLVFGGFGIGLVFAGAMAYSLKRMVNDYVQETNLTLVTTYLLFLVCDNKLLDSSGALAVMTLGLFMSAYGKILISPVVQKQLKFIWFMISRNTQALVFIIAGMKLGAFLSDFSIKDFGLAFALFVIIHIIRGTVIIIHYPIIKYFGYGINKREIIVLTFAGLKGVISSALSLIVYNDEGLNGKFKSTVIFFTMTIVALSILFDTILVRFFLHKFEMDSLTLSQESVLLGVTNTIIQETTKKIEKIAEQPDTLLMKWNEVLEIAGPKTILVEIMSKSNIGKEILNKNQESSVYNLTCMYNSRFNLTDDKVSIEFRMRFYSILKRVYWNNFEAGQCRGSSALKLMDSCNKALDNPYSPMNDWSYLEKSIYNKKRMEYYKRHINNNAYGGIFRKFIYNRVIKAYDIAHTFVRARYSAEKIIDSMDMEVDDEILQMIIEEAHSQIVLCQGFIKENITDSYPEIIADVQTKMSTFMLLNSQRRLVGKIHEQGLVKQQEYKHLASAIDANFKLLTFMSNPRIPSLAEMLKDRFKNSTWADIKKILPVIEEKHYQPNTLLYEKDTPITGAYLIFSGTIHEYGDGLTYTLRKSNIAGAYTLTEFFPYNYVTSARTTSVVIAALIPFNALKAECFTQDVYREAAKYIVLYKKDYFDLKASPSQHILRVVENSNVWYLQAGAPINLRRGALVLNGMVREDKSTFSLLRPCKKIIESYDDTVLLIFPPHFGAVMKQHRNLTDAFASYFIKYKSRVNREEFENQLIVSTFKITDIEDSSDTDD